MNDELQTFLEEAAASAGSSVDEVLCGILHIGGSDAMGHVDGMRPEVAALFMELDHAIRVRNPGSHYVQRKMYLGYRRERRSIVTSGERSQVFLSVLRSVGTLDLVLPIDPSPFVHLPWTKDLTGQGHHGVGELKVSISSSEELNAFLDEFKDWLSAD